ncbi:MAG TPA: hypothetical protein VLA93_06350 [Pyrinomonadaceae bacterium]|nr:hypothetical protein [Pyrinomonadaceae bacterium]
MTESEVFEAVTNGGSSDFAILIDILNRHGSWCLIGGLKKDELDLMRILEAYPETRALMPEQIKTQVPE